MDNPMTSESEPQNLVNHIQRALKEISDPSSDPALIGQVHHMVVQQIYHDLVTGFGTVEDESLPDEDECEYSEYKELANKSFVPQDSDQRINYLQFFARATGIPIPTAIIAPFIEHKARTSGPKEIEHVIKLSHLADDPEYFTEGMRDSVASMLLRSKIVGDEESTKSLEEVFADLEFSAKAAEDAYSSRESIDYEHVENMFVPERREAILELTGHGFSPHNLQQYLQSRSVAELEDKFIPELEKQMPLTQIDDGVLHKHEDKFNESEEIGKQTLDRLDELTGFYSGILTGNVQLKALEKGFLRVFAQLYRNSEEKIATDDLQAKAFPHMEFKNKIQYQPSTHRVKWRHVKELVDICNDAGILTPDKLKSWYATARKDSNDDFADNLALFAVANGLKQAIPIADLLTKRVYSKNSNISDLQLFTRLAKIDPKIAQEHREQAYEFCKQHGKGFALADLYELTGVVPELEPEHAKTLIPSRRGSKEITRVVKMMRAAGLEPDLDKVTRALCPATDSQAFPEFYRAALVEADTLGLDVDAAFAKSAASYLIGHWSDSIEDFQSRIEFAREVHQRHKIHLQEDQVKRLTTKSAKFVMAGRDPIPELRKQYAELTKEFMDVLGITPCLKSLASEIPEHISPSYKPDISDLRTIWGIGNDPETQAELIKGIGNIITYHKDGHRTASDLQQILSLNKDELSPQEKQSIKEVGMSAVKDGQPTAAKELYQALGLDANYTEDEVNEIVFDYLSRTMDGYKPSTGDFNLQEILEHLGPVDISSAVQRVYGKRALRDEPRFGLLKEVTGMDVSSEAIKDWESEWGLQHSKGVLSLYHWRVGLKLAEDEVQDVYANMADCGHVTQIGKLISESDIAPPSDVLDVVIDSALKKKSLSDICTDLNKFYFNPRWGGENLNPLTENQSKRIYDKIRKPLSKMKRGPEHKTYENLRVDVVGDELQNEIQKEIDSHVENGNFWHAYFLTTVSGMKPTTEKELAKSLPRRSAVNVGTGRRSDWRMNVYKWYKGDSQ